MKTICFYFQIHQPFRLKRYRFFDIGLDSYYYDDFANEDIIRGIAQRTYFPANAMLLDLIEEYKGKFKVAFSISGIALEQMEMYVPEAIDQFKELAKTGCVEFLAETYDHSLASIMAPDEFQKQVEAHKKKIKELFGQEPTVFRNTELIYSDDIALQVASMGFKAMLVEGAKHVLGWKSPNYLYASASAPKLKLLTRNMKYSDDISYRFSNYNWSEYPLVADKFVNWITSTPEEEQLVNVFMNYDVLGSLQPAETGIFDFFKAVPRFAFAKGITFSTPSDIVKTFKSVGELIVPYPCSWAGEEKDISPWMGNVLQKEALNKLYSVAEKIHMRMESKSEARRLLQSWSYLQSGDHFNYMSTKHFSSPSIFSPYENAYDAFNNYMNVLSDFITRVNNQFPDGLEIDQLDSLTQLVEALEKKVKETESVFEDYKKKHPDVAGKSPESTKSTVRKKKKE